MFYRNYLNQSLGILLGVGFVWSGLEGLMLLMSGESVVMEWELSLISSGSFSFCLYFDYMSCMFFSFVSLISCSIMFYIGSYMKGDENMDRFVLLVFSFVGSMFFLVFSLNMVSILLGWDGLGLTSYLLVVYYQNEKSNGAGMITALSNRVGDAAILLSIGAMVDLGSWNFMLVDQEQIKGSLIVLFVVIAAMTKSAQMPFSAWLPAAMAAPTPVSALVHSSTLVTAGVYLLIRFSPLLSDVSWWLVSIGSLTTFMASVSANMETDLKKVIALSTLSQLGIMMFSLGMGLPLVTFFHLLTHATFKALLFMCAGKVIHESGSTQDSRSMGSLLQSLPFSAVCINISNLALCGFPFMAGFYSKDMLVELSFMDNSTLFFTFIMGLNVGMSAMYSIRLAISSMVGSSWQMPLSSGSEDDELMLNSKLGLVFMAVCSGAILGWLLFSSCEMVSLPLVFKLYALVTTFAGGGLGYCLYLLKSKGLYLSIWLGTSSFFMQMWFLPWISGILASKFSLESFKSFKKLDLGWWEIMGGQGVYSLVTFSSSNAVFMGQMNYIKAFMTSFGLLVIMGVWILYL